MAKNETPPMTDHAPRSEGMSEPMTDERLKEIAAREAKATAGPWKAVFGTRCLVLRDTEDELGYELIGVCGWGDTHKIRTLSRDANADFIAHSRQDVTELRSEVLRLRADGATLRERVRKLPTPVNPQNDFNRQHVHVWYCRWCGESWPRNATTSDADHPDNGCLWRQVHDADK